MEGGSGADSRSRSPPLSAVDQSERSLLRTASLRSNATLQDVLKVNPLESEAETLILRAIERDESKTAHNLLPNVPADSAPIFQQASAPEVVQQAPGGEDRKPPLAVRKPVTVGNTLEELTDALEDIHDDDAADSVPEQPIPPPSTKPTAGENLVNTAGLIFREKSKRGKLDTIPDDEVANGGGGITDAGIVEEEDAQDTAETGRVRKKRKPSRCDRLFRTRQQAHVVRDLSVFAQQRRRSLLTYLRAMLLVVIPATLAACILYYFFDNEPTGRIDFAKSTDATLINHHGKTIDPTQASHSWWILFICVRQVITGTLAHLIQIFIIEFLCLNTRFFTALLGNMCTLFVVQSRGWPFLLFMWSCLNFGLLNGKSKFASNWLYWQDELGVFSESNPSGTVIEGKWNTTLITVCMIVSVCVSVKRFWLGLYLGKKTYANHGEDLAKVVRKVVLVCEIAAAARERQWNRAAKHKRGLTPFSYRDLGLSSDEMARYLKQEDSSKSLDGNAAYTDAMETQRTMATDDEMFSSRKIKIDELLGAWEDPEDDLGAEENVSISNILRFRQSLSFLEKPFFFSLAWGSVSTREQMVESTEAVYEKLKGSAPVLNFKIFALLAQSPNEDINRDKIKELIRLLRPDRDGTLKLLDFVKSIDAVYKEVKLLRASIRNSEKIDKALENLINFAFYFVLTCLIIGQLGYNPMTLFLSFSSLALGVSFVVGSAAAKTFEGWLFILIRRPYSIGDRIHISHVESDTSADGSSSWIVKDVSLYHTILVFATTGERATLANGSIASSRVINMARSPNAVLYVHVKFPYSAPFEKIEMFESVLRSFVKDRPREWANFAGFRASVLQTDLGYVEYKVILQHRESWQNIGALLVSKAEVASFCVELAKKLDLRYSSPPLPVDLAVVKRNRGAQETELDVVADFNLAGLEIKA